MKSASFECPLILPQIQRFSGWIDAVARGAVKIETNMDAMLLSGSDRLIQMFQLRFAHLPHVFLRRPTEVGHRKADKIETPLVQRGKIGIREGWVSSGPGHKLFGEIEPAPPRER